MTYGIIRPFETAKGRHVEKERERGRVSLYVLVDMWELVRKQQPEVLLNGWRECEQGGRLEQRWLN